MIWLALLWACSLALLALVPLYIWLVTRPDEWSSIRERENFDRAIRGR